MRCEPSLPRRSRTSSSASRISSRFEARSRRCSTAALASGRSRSARSSKPLRDVEERRSMVHVGGRHARGTRSERAVSRVRRRVGRPTDFARARLPRRRTQGALDARGDAGGRPHRLALSARRHRHWWTLAVAAIGAVAALGGRFLLFDVLLYGGMVLLSAAMLGDIWARKHPRIAAAELAQIRVNRNGGCGRCER